jgi:hypothetical protein
MNGRAPRAFLAWALVALLSASCTALGLGLDGLDSGADGSTDALSDASGGARLRVPASNGSYGLSFGISVGGRGSQRVGNIAIDGGFGTVVVDGVSLPVAVHERQEWTAFGYNLYQSLAISGDRWVVLWFYCRGGALTDIYWESTAGGGIRLESASGDCAESSSPSTVQASFPAIDMPLPPLVGGFEVTGANVGIHGATPGWVRVGGREYDVYVFSYVDCTVECGSPGWHELHALLWDRARGWLCFAIFYLFRDERAIQLSYSFSLPALVEPFSTTVLTGATWTTR